MRRDPLPIVHKRCFNHGTREAAARCPDCGRYFCRECVTEHEDRVICASCLVKLKNIPGRKQISLGLFLNLIRCSCGILVLWLFFYFLGQILLNVPIAFHDGTIWDVAW